MTVLATSWPIAVVREDPNALRVWVTEISEKTGVLQTLPHRSHSLLAEQWPGMVLPWSLIALVAVVLPFFPETRDRSGEGERCSGRAISRVVAPVVCLVVGGG